MSDASIVETVHIYCILCAVLYLKHKLRHANVLISILYQQYDCEGKK